jgi:hypothetical protein
MANNGKATNSDPQYCTQKINNFGTQIQRKAGVSSCSPDGLVNLMMSYSEIILEQRI